MILKYFQYLKENFSKNDFKVGDKVKCIDTSGFSGRYFEKSKIYTVSSVFSNEEGIVFLNFIHMNHRVYASRFIKIEDSDELAKRLLKSSEEHKDIDPYGEEDWIEDDDLEFESVNYLQKRIFEPGDFVYCTDLSGYAGKFFKPGKYYEIKDIDYDDYDHNFTLLFFDVGISKGWNSGRFKKVEDESIMGDIKKRRLELNKIHKEVDPYGEDEWENENYIIQESRDDENIEVGDWVYCLDYFHSNDKLKCDTYYKVKNVCFASGIKYLSFEVDIGSWFAHRFRKIEDISLIDELNKKRQEIIDKHKHIDPYGEDEWSNESASLREFRVGDKVICIDTGDYSGLVLNDIYTVSQMDTECVYLEELEEKGPRGFYKRRFRLSPEYENEYLKKLEEYLDKNADIDPYGEDFTFFKD